MVKSPTFFFLWGSMTGAIHLRKVDTRDELLTRILDTAADTKRGEYQLKGKQTRYLRTSYKAP